MSNSNGGPCKGDNTDVRVNRVASGSGGEVSADITGQLAFNGSDYWLVAARETRYGFFKALQGQ